MLEVDFKQRHVNLSRSKMRKLQSPLFHHYSCYMVGLFIATAGLTYLSIANAWSVLYVPCRRGSTALKVCIIVHDAQLPTPEKLCGTADEHVQTHVPTYAIAAHGKVRRKSSLAQVGIEHTRGQPHTHVPRSESSRMERDLPAARIIQQHSSATISLHRESALFKNVFISVL